MKFNPASGRWVRDTPRPATTRREPAPEHAHRWEPLGVTEIVGSVAFEMDSCGIRGCKCRRARRAVEETPEAEERANRP